MCLVQYFWEVTTADYTISKYNKVMEAVVQFVGMEVKILSFEWLLKTVLLFE